jgi:Domain of unknown function (DUF5666)
MNRPSIHLPDGRVLAGVITGVLIGVIGVGAVTASPATPAAAGTPAAITQAAPTTPASSAAPFRPGTLRALVRNNFRVSVAATGPRGTRNILYVRGSLAISAGSLTVTLPDGSTATFKTDATTIVRDKGQVVPISNLQSGERAMVFGLRNDDGSYTARLIRCVRAAAAPQANPSASPAP